MAQTQQYSPEAIENFATAFPRRNDASFAYGNAISLFLSLPGLRSYYPCGANLNNGANVFVTDIANGYNLTIQNTPQFGVYGASAPYIDFTRASSQYAFYADNAHFDITGTEAYIENPGLTIGCWVWFDTESMGVLTGELAKFQLANQQSYAIYKLASDIQRFNISVDGINGTTVDSTVSISANTWYFKCGRFVPSTSVDIFVNNTKTSNVAAIPASIFNSTAQLEMGVRSGNYLDGKISHAFVCASALSDAQIKMLYWLTKPLFYGN